MDEIIVNQIKYISSKRAAAATGYAKDYIGQLVRMGKVDAKRVGRAWYVRESQILSIAGKSATVGIAKTQSERTTELSGHSNVVTKLRTVGVSPLVASPVWGDVKYIEDKEPLMPISDKRDTHLSDEVSSSVAVVMRSDVSTPIYRSVQNPSVRDVSGVVVLRHSVQPTKVTRYMQSDVIRAVNSIERQQYVAVERYSAGWSLRALLTILIASCASLLMPIFL